MKYFLYMYHSNSEEELNMSQETDLGNSSIDCETEQNKDGGGWYKKHRIRVKIKLLITTLKSFFKRSDQAGSYFNR